VKKLDGGCSVGDIVRFSDREIPMNGRFPKVQLSVLGAEKFFPVAYEKAIRGIKFSECLSPRLADEVTSMRLRGDAAVTSVLNEDVLVAIPPPDDNFKPSIGSRRSSHATPNQPETAQTIRAGDREVEVGDASATDKSTEP
jgi:hypothetical protein